jgi:hypothetical protein
VVSEVLCPLSWERGLKHLTRAASAWEDQRSLAERRPRALSRRSYVPPNVRFLNLPVDWPIGEMGRKWPRAQKTQSPLHSPQRDRRSPAPTAPRSPQSRNLRVGSQIPLDIVTGRPKDHAGGAPGLELGKPFAQLLMRSRERHLFGGGHVHQRVVPV